LTGVPERTDNICVYDDGVLVGGIEPDGTKPATPTPTSSQPPSDAPTPTAKKSNLDITGDGVINMADVIAIAKKFNTTKNDPNYDASCDLNSDGAINMADVILIASKFNTQV